MHEKALQMAILESKTNKDNHYCKGGPFGAVIVKNEEVIASAHNTVLEGNDATAHAEINAIRAASKILQTHDLSGCTIYVNAEPCPMCLSAIIWANIKEVYYANTRMDAGKIGFRDDIIYDFLEGQKSDLLKVYHIDSKEALEVFEDFKKIDDKIMY